MYKTLRSDVPPDKDYPARTYEIMWRERVRDGGLYDHLSVAFHDEKNSAGEYVQLRHRRPSVRYNLCRTVIDDSVSLLFSEGHFPVIRCKNKDTAEMFKRIIKERKLNELMIDAATKGSVGSVAILMQVFKGKPFFKALDTKYLTPHYDPTDPDRLVKVVEAYKVKRDQLIAVGITPPTGDSQFWWRVEWTENAELHFVPQTIEDAREGKQPTASKDRSVEHKLGFCPLIWVKNLPGGDDIDGACTFPNEAVDTQIELEYQLSQVGRGLKYSSDPTLLLKEPAVGEDGEVVKGAANAIVVSEKGDAKLLEINGTAAEAVMKYVKLLREYGLENLKGRSADPAKLSAARSAKAMELLNQPLIWLSDRLRISYGEGAFLAVMNLLIKASQKIALKLNDTEAIGKLEAGPLTLHWPTWYAPTQEEKNTQATALKQLTDSNILSKESATEIVGPVYDIEDTKTELTRIEADRARLAAEQAKTQIAVQA